MRQFQRLLALLLGLFLLAPSALADMILEPEDDFFAENREKCEYLYRQYTTNGPEGYITLYESPQSLRERENIPNGQVLDSDWRYEEDGEIWGVIWAEDYNTLRGWFRLSDCTPVPDYISFREAYGQDFVPYDPAYDNAFDGLDAVVLWRYPGLGVLSDRMDPSWFQEEPEQRFQDCYLDEEGRFWGFAAYSAGIRNAWICLSDPSNPELAMIQLPQAEQPVVPPAGDIPAPTSGVSDLTLTLVAAVVVGTGVLIAVLFRKKEPSLDTKDGE